MLGLALWVGGCTLVSSAFRYNRGYAAVLAGYTVALVAFGAISEPDRIFELAIGRVAVVSVGVISAALVFMVTDLGPGPAVLQRRLLQLISSTSLVIAQAFSSADLTSPRMARSALAADLLALDQMVEFATAEDAALGRYAGDLRVASARLFSGLTGGLRMAMLLRGLEPEPDRAAAEAVRTSLLWIAALDPGTPAAAITSHIAETEAMLRDAAAATQDLVALSAYDQAALLFSELHEALDSLGALQNRRPRRPRVQLRGYVNWSTALRNGTRAAIAITLAGLFWIVSQWPSGAGTITLIAPLCALLAQNDSASAASIAFFKGVVIAVIAAFLCGFGILPQMSGYLLLLAGILPFVGVGLLAGSVPRYAGTAQGYLIFLFALVAPTNPMVFDLAGSLNSYFASLIGGLCVVLAFRTLLPPNPKAEAAVIARSLRAAILKRPTRQPLPFENVQHQKLSRLSLRLVSRPDLRFAAVGEAVVGLLIARQLTTLGRAAADPDLPASARRLASSILADASGLYTDPLALSARALTGIPALTNTEAAARLPQRRLAACLQEFASLVEMDAPFLRGGGTLAA